MKTADIERLYSGFKRRCVGTEYKLAVLPKRCHLSNKLIWFNFGYKQTAIWTGPGDDIFEHRWYNKDEFIIAKIKGIV
jgi:hypothetical protein